MAASSRRKGPHSITNLAGDLLNDAQALADDALGRAGDLERDARPAVRRAVAKVSTDAEIVRLKAALEDLTAKVNRLATLQTDGGKRRR